MTDTIDTVATITAVHRALQIAATMPEGPARNDLMLSATSALSVVSFFLRYPLVNAPPEKVQSVNQLLATLQQIAGPSPVT